ncbi:MAG: hypothetical protein ACREM6_14005 [Vulcanimicrobiaceae bacterium]
MAHDPVARPLDTGDAFPRLSLTLVDGSTVELPKTGRWTVFAIYRGEW